MTKSIQLWLSKEEIEVLKRNCYFSHMAAQDKEQSDNWMNLTKKFEKALKKAEDNE